jgi:TfoX/Sxy family transcriptional regulator of competence genes
MATEPEVMEFILGKLGFVQHFGTRRMFGEYALYADGKVVGLICDNQLYVKIHKATSVLENICEKDPPYQGASLYYLVEESQLEEIDDLAEILLSLSAELPLPKPKAKKKTIKK